MTAAVATVDTALARRGALIAFRAQLLRDMHVLRKTSKVFLLRTVMQPALTVFVFTYVFPKIGQGIGGGRGADEFSTLLVPGVMATACIFQGIQAVALPLVQEFGYTREIDDRVLAPLPVWAVGLEKLIAGALQGVLAALVVFPLGAVIPATPVHLAIHWPLVLTIIPLATLLGAALGLAIGTTVEPRQVPLVFSVIVIPMTFLGAVYYPWDRLGPISWLKWAVLINPLMYMSEGFRAALTKGIPHMSLPYIYAAMLSYTALLAWAGIRGFRKRVVQ
ncbi:MAG: type transport system permease protein [Acidimicrobiaceae bacterium]|jgi:ABC-2 type transport system permease protein|nr:type transport system permease protein [Acidimicrobiaceae bacterium]MDQ1445998.1 type transport system permease protein [Acidimicrobiaceae bacterium]